MTKKPNPSLSKSTIKLWTTQPKLKPKLITSPSSPSSPSSPHSKPRPLKLHFPQVPIPEDYYPISSTAKDQMFQVDASLIRSLDDVRSILNALQLSYSGQVVDQYQLHHLVTPVNNLKPQA